MKNYFNLSFLFVAMCFVACVPSSKTWDDVSFLYRNTEILTITKVEFADTATILSVNAKYPSGKWIRIEKGTRLVADKNKSYRLVSSDEIAIGKRISMPESGEIDFKLFFEPMPKNTAVFDYVESSDMTAFCIYGLHDTNRPLKQPKFKNECSESEMAEGFFRTDTVYIKGKIDGYSRDMGFSNILMARKNEITREDMPLVIDVQPDGSFETFFVADYPKFESIFIQASDFHKGYLIYVVPACTTMVNIDKDWNLDITSPDKDVLLCESLVEKRLFNMRLLDYSERKNAVNQMTFNDYKNFVLDKGAVFINLMDYLSWQNQLTPKERYYLRLHAKSEMMNAILSYPWFLNSRWMQDYVRMQGNREDTTLRNNVMAVFDFKNYEFMRDMSPNDVSMLTMYNFPFSNYALSYILNMNVSDIIVDSASVLIRKDTTMLNNDMRIMGTSEPTLLGRISIMFSSGFYLECLREANIEQRKYVEMKKSLLNHPYLESELERMYAKELAQQVPYFSLPEGEASNLLRRMTDKYRGKYLMIDFWGMNCAPCRGEIERSKAMREALRNHPEVDFLFIAAPASTQEAYDKYVKKNLDGEDCQLVSQDEFNQLMQLFGFMGIPHHETLDKDGNVLTESFEYASTADVFLQQLN